MCGRFTLRTNLYLLASEFGYDQSVTSDWRPRYNIAPTQQIFVLREGLLSQMKWGLIPPWAREAKVGNTMINARGETIAEKRSFKKPFEKQRCLIPADGFYEWQKLGKEKQPLLFELHDKGLFAFAGLWEANKEFGESCTIITTSANGTLAPYHDRMPVIVDRADWQIWLANSSSKAQLESLVRPAPNDLLTTTPVSKTVNSPRHDGPECVEPQRSQ